MISSVVWPERALACAGCEIEPRAAPFGLDRPVRAICGRDIGCSAYPRGRGAERFAEADVRDLRAWGPHGVPGGGAGSDH